MHLTRALFVAVLRSHHKVGVCQATDFAYLPSLWPLPF